MPVIDFHTHLFSRSFYQALHAQAGRGDTLEAAVAAARAKGAAFDLPPADTAAHTRGFLAGMDRAGVERAVTFASLPEERDEVARAAEIAGGRLVPFCVVNPKATNAITLLDELHSRRFAGVVLFPVLHHYSPDAPALAPFWDRVAAHRFIVTAHCGALKITLRQALGAPTLYDLSYANPLPLATVAQRYPAVPFVIPHFGGGFLRETLMAGDACPNLFLDTSSSNSWIRFSEAALTLESVMRGCVAVYGVSRILYGSDTGVLPRGYRADVLQNSRAAAAAAGLIPAEVDLVMGGNAARLLAGARGP
ncbi:MAG: amidohydrolase [Planctomycetes bacterium]|nr:amidohydrolase [Planctomycetota bacterium]